MAPERTYKALGVKIDVFPDRVEIERRWPSPEGRGTKTIPLINLTDVAVRQASPFSNPNLVLAMKGFDAEVIRCSGWTPSKAKEFRDYLAERVVAVHRPTLPQAVQPAHAPSTFSMSIADEIGKLAKLKEQGAITPAEFETLKARLINGG